MEKPFCIVGFLLALLVFSSASGIAKKDILPYVANCSFSVDEAISPSCVVALFSYVSFDVSGALDILTLDLCEISSPTAIAATATSTSNTIAVVHRGGCAFDTKAKAAQKAGYKALVILSADKDLFPMGTSDESFRADIPVVMMDDDILNQIDSLLSYTNEQQKQHCISHIFSDKDDQQPILECVSFDRSSVRGRLALSISTSPRPKPNVGGRDGGRSATNNWSKLMRNLFQAGAILLTALTVFSWFLSHRTIIINSISDGDMATASWTRSAGLGSTVHWMTVLAIIIFSIALRMGTFRPLQNSSAPLSPLQGSGQGELSVLFNHRENDELIFEALVDSVYENYRAYSLAGHPIVERLRLAPENYGDSLFIHPPLFVYSSMILNKYFLLPLPLIPLLMQAATLLCIPLLVGRLMLALRFSQDSAHSSSSSSSSSLSSPVTATVSCRAVVFLSLCPIVAFVSQKFWIDNCAMLAVTIAATIHLYCVDTIPTTSTSNLDGSNSKRSLVDLISLLQHFASGLVFGGVALNCKITCAALAPFLFGWIVYGVLCRLDYISQLKLSWEQVCQLLKTSFVLLFVFSLGMSISCAPWVILYKSHTGRFFPNAWPSATMIKNSKFLQMAINKPWYYYLSVLSTLSPPHAVAMLFGVACAGVALTSLSSQLLTTLTCTSTPKPNDLDQKQLSDSTTSTLLAVDVTTTGTSAHLYFFIGIGVLALWPICFCTALSFIGCMGAGYQSRFLLPLLPATSILASFAIEYLKQRQGVVAAVADTLSSVMVTYQAMHFMFYGVMFAPLFADLDFSIVDVLHVVLTTPYHSPISRESFTSTLAYLAHFGVQRQAA